MAVRESCCDCFAETHFWHNNSGVYIFERDMKCLDAKLGDFKSGKYKDLNT